MKKITTGLFTGFVMLISSCVMTKTYTTEEKKMRLDKGGEKVFVVKTNGEKIIGKKLSQPSAWSAHSTWIKVDNEKIGNADIIAFQDKEAYHVKFGNKERWTWVKQLKRGKINLYHYEVSGNKTGYNSVVLGERFVFQKGSERLLESNISEIADMLKDNKRAYSIFTAQFGSKDKNILPKQLEKHPKALFEAIDAYNGTL